MSDNMSIYKVNYQTPNVYFGKLRDPKILKKCVKEFNCIYETTLLTNKQTTICMRCRKMWGRKAPFQVSDFLCKLRMLSTAVLGLNKAHMDTNSKLSKIIIMYFFFFFIWSLLHRYTNKMVCRNFHP